MFQTSFAAMGVKGLWTLLGPTGQTSSLERLRGKVLAVDLSIWLNQAIKGVRDRKGFRMQHAHLLTLFHRICKLLYYGIKPVFVFDGMAPLLKRKTLAARQRERENAECDSSRLAKRMLRVVLKQQALATAIGGSPPRSAEVPGPSSRKGEEEDVFRLPPLSEESNRILEEEEKEEEEQYLAEKQLRDDLQGAWVEADLVEPAELDSLPCEIQHELLLEQRERLKRRPQHAIPKESLDFSKFQLDGLLKRSQLTRRLDSITKQMGQSNYPCPVEGSIEARCLISEDGGHYILVEGLKNLKAQTGEAEEHSPNRYLSECSNQGLDKIEAEDRGTDRKSAGRPTSSSSINPLIESISEAVHKDSVKKLLPLKEGLTNRQSHELVIDDINLPNTGYKPDSVNEHSKDHKGSRLLRWTSKTSPSQLLAKKIAKTRVEMLDSETESSSDGSVCGKAREVNSEDVNNAESGASIQEAGYEVTRSSSKDGIGILDDVDNLMENSAKLDTECSLGGTKEHLSATAGVFAPIKTPICITAEETKVPAETAQLFQSSTEQRFGTSTAPQDVQSTTFSHSESSDETDFLDVQSCEISSDGEDCMEGHVTTVESAVVQTLGSPSVEEEHSSDEMVETTEFSGIMEEEFPRLQEKLQLEGQEIQKQQSDQHRRAATVTQQMQLECQDLLRLFGLPYVEAPGEAEAQCAALDLGDKTHGTITDDSDIWLFGGRYVYRHFFSSTHDVQLYQATEIHRMLGLDRRQLVNLAYLLGSDYTNGVPGVGCILAVEILNEFSEPGKEPFLCLKEWWETARKTGGIVVHPSRVRRKLVDIEFPPGFPEAAVAQAYLEPAVDTRQGSFTWGSPLPSQIKEFCLRRFGWNFSKTDEQLRPVLQQMSKEQKKQTLMDSFISVDQPQETIIWSKRLSKAVLGMKQKMECSASEPRPDTNPPSGNQQSNQVGAVSGGFLSHGFVEDDSRHSPPSEALIEEKKNWGKKRKAERYNTTNKYCHNMMSSDSSSDDASDRDFVPHGLRVSARPVFSRRGHRKRGRGQASSKKS
uniref:DNA repair protein complementing XP-G cells n=1 Tax=Eptatretus burgeri TaxID=7764 RepID=A0A8C4QYU8_EPTBU